MERREVERWLATHPETIHTDPQTLLDRCERDVRTHTHVDAWAHARDVAEHRLHQVEHEFSLPASEAFVAREICHELARELRRKEPHVTPEEEAELLPADLLEALEPQARETLRSWIHELAEKEEHTAWIEIVQFTDHCAKNLIRRAHMSDKAEWDFDHSYTHNAAKVARMLIQEYEGHMRTEAIPQSSIG